MKIKPFIYFASAAAGVLALFMGPGWLGSELGLALGFVLLLFGLYGISRGIPSRDADKDQTDGL